ncbi:hypothetical protein EC968_010549 [Mortierella alpina]|nr:hypothetical protein EC968_010549 [Mortierella alpina]
MAHKDHSSRWLPLFLLILLCTILLQAASSSSSTSSSSSSSSAAAAAAAAAAPHGHALRRTQGSQRNAVLQPRSIDDDSESTDPQEPRSSSLVPERVFAPATSLTSTAAIPDDDESDVDQDDEQQEQEQEQEDEDEEEALAQDPRLRQNKASGLLAPRRDVKTTSYNCDSLSPQTLGPAWNGTFMSNAPDGVYPSETRSCTWTIQAMPAIASVTGSAPYIVELKFWTPIQLVCGIDYLTVYDGPDTTAPVIAQLCGNIWMDNLPVLYSSGSTMTAVFSTQARSPGSFGFKAGWISCRVISAQETAEGPVAPILAPATAATPARSAKQHAMAYDANKDIVYITGGTNFQTPFLPMNDVITYSFASNKWNKLTSKKKEPDARLGHYSFMYNNDLYIYGGVTNYAGMADVWKFNINNKQWSELFPANPDLLPVGRRGAACVFITTGNYTGRLYVFGGMNSAGETKRELSYFDVTTSRWSRVDHQNSVGLTGATAIYHHATDSIYFFGGMINQTTRNVVPYQYFIQQDLWHALPPKFDPLTSTPVPSPYTDESSMAPRPLNSSLGDNNEQDGDDNSSSDGRGAQYSTGQQYLPPVMYDPLSAVWAPADVMGEDTVVVFGGMRPFGLGSNVRDQSCYARTVSMYDLSCQNWTSFDVTEVTGGAIKTRVNHTMVIRPPGAPGGSRTSWTAYIFGGFDGAHRSDVLNITLNLAPMAAADVNNCRALRWCNLYDDCQNCNPTYCSYVNGLCLFDTDKAEASSVHSAAPFYLLGAAADVPRNGTVQDLIRQRPELRPQVLSSLDACPARTGLDIGTLHEYDIQPGQEMTFKTYIDAQDHDILYEIRTTPPTMSLQFSSLNVWEGYMNMYWRATHGLTDDSWDGVSGTSSPIPSDIPQLSPGPNGTMPPPDRPVITLAGVLNTSELMNRWTKYAGLDGSPSSSALRQTVSTTDLLFLAGDPRRFSGYYVYSIKNPNPEKLTFTLMITLVNHSDGDDKDEKSKFDLATLGFFMVGFIVGVLLLVLVGRKIRKMLEEREQVRRAAAELRMFQEEEEEEERRRQEAMATASLDRESLKDMKPMYRVVVGVQDQQECDLLGIPTLGLQPNTLRHRSVRHSAPMTMSAAADAAAAAAGDSATAMATAASLEAPRRTTMSTAVSLTPPTITTTPATVWESSSTLPRSWSDPSEIRVIDDQEDKRSSTGRSSDVIRDLGSMPSTSRLGRSKTVRASSTERSLSSLQRTWSLSSLSHSSSVKRFLSPTKRTLSEEKEGLANSCCSQTSNEDDSYAGGLETSTENHPDNAVEDDLGHEVIELGTLAHVPDDHDDHDDDEVQVLQPSLPRGREHRNPIRVQPISIEPLPFHGGLVPRTRRQLLRYQRTLQRHALHGGSPRGSLASRRRGRVGPPGRESGRARGALQTARTAASRLTLLAGGGSARSGEGRGRLLSREGSLLRAGESPLAEEEEARRGRRRMKLTDRGAQEQEYEPGPLLAVNVLIVFPGDAGTRRVLKAGGEKKEKGRGSVVGGDDDAGDDAKEEDDDDEGEGEGEARLPPMAIGTMMVPDPVRWWAYKARQQVDRRRFEREMRRLHSQKKEARLSEKATP